MKGGIAVELFQITPAAARVNAGLTQTELAEKMGVTKQTVINWEKGYIVMGVAQLCLLADITGVPKDYIFLPNNSTKSRVE